MIARLMVYMSQLHYDTTWDPLVPLAPAGAAPNLKGDIDTGGGLQGEGGDGAAGDEGGGDNVVVEESKGKLKGVDGMPDLRIYGLLVGRDVGIVEEKRGLSEEYLIILFYLYLN